MDNLCAQIRQAIAQAEELRDPTLRDHAASCEDCADRLSAAEWLGAADRVLAPGAPPVSAVASGWESLRRRILAVPRPLDWLRTRGVALRVGLLVAAAAAVTVAQRWNLRADLDAYPLGRMVGTLGGLALCAVLAWRLALRPLHRPRMAAAWAVGLLAAVLILPVVLAALPQAQTGNPASLGGTGSDLVSHALACFGYGALWSAPVLAQSLAADRTPSLRPPPVWLAFGATGLVGNLALQVHCPLTAPAHLLAGHASLGVVLTGCAAAVLRWRRRSGPP